jgi:septum formation protein
VVLGADTVVVAPDGRILGKPEDEAGAREMLRLLCGGERRTHRVVTGCCLFLPQDVEGARRREEFWAETEVTMGAQPEPVIAAYAATGEPLDKAGAYAIQGRGAFLVEHVCGSYTNVVGLPLARVLEVLVSWGVVIPGQD